jgi:molybdopterin synthase catalytic subunit
MRRELTISTDPIDEAKLLKSRIASHGAGAAIYFAGIVRRLEAEAQITAIEYEAFEKMARHQFELIFGHIEQRWPIESVRLVHRIGIVPVNEASLWVEVIAPHRGEAFAACQYLIDKMKESVPIWKKPIGISQAK